MEIGIIFNLFSLIRYDYANSRKSCNMALLLKAEGSTNKGGKLFDEAYERGYHIAAFSMPGLTSLQERMIPYCANMPISTGGVFPSLSQAPNFGCIVKDNQSAITFQRIDWRTGLVFIDK